MMTLFGASLLCGAFDWSLCRDETLEADPSPDHEAVLKPLLLELVIVITLSLTSAPNNVVLGVQVQV